MNNIQLSAGKIYDICMLHMFLYRLYIPIIYYNMLYTFTSLSVSLYITRSTTPFFINMCRGLSMFPASDFDE